MKTTDYFKTTIQNYLEQRAQSDELFAPVGRTQCGEHVAPFDGDGQIRGGHASRGPSTWVPDHALWERLTGCRRGI